MANRLFDLPETKGSFQIKGLVSGTKKENFLKEKKTKTQKEMRIVNFGIEYKKGSTAYVNLMGIEQGNVYFFSSQKGADGKYPPSEKVAWADRFTYNRDGYRMIGNNIGVKKKADDKGNLVNDKKILTDFDACKEIAENLQDGNSVFVKGTLDFSSFVDDKGSNKRSVKLQPKQVSLCQDVVFNEEYEIANDFKQVIIFMGIDQEKDDDGKATNRFIVAAKIVNYSSIEDAEFVIEDKKLANIFKKNLKSYYAIEVHGKIENFTLSETVEEDDGWGESSVMDQVSAPTKREFIITGAKPSTIEKERYSESNINEALKAINKANKAEEAFGSNDWSSDSATDITDEDDEEW